MKTIDLGFTQGIGGSPNYSFYSKECINVYVDDGIIYPLDEYTTTDTLTYTSANTPLISKKIQSPYFSPTSAIVADLYLMIADITISDTDQTISVETNFLYGDLANNGINVYTSTFSVSFRNFVAPTGASTYYGVNCIQIEWTPNLGVDSTKFGYVFTGAILQMDNLGETVYSYSAPSYLSTYNNITAFAYTNNLDDLNDYALIVVNSALLYQIYLPDSTLTPITLSNTAYSAISSLAVATDDFSAYFFLIVTTTTGAQQLWRVDISTYDVTVLTEPFGSMTAVYWDSFLYVPDQTQTPLVVWSSSNGVAFSGDYGDTWSYIDAATLTDNGGSPDVNWVSQSATFITDDTGTLAMWSCLISTQTGTLLFTAASYSSVDVASSVCVNNFQPSEQVQLGIIAFSGIEAFDSPTVESQVSIAFSYGETLERVFYRLEFNYVLNLLTSTTLIQDETYTCLADLNAMAVNPQYNAAGVTETEIVIAISGYGIWNIPSLGPDGDSNTLTQIFEVYQPYVNDFVKLSDSTVVYALQYQGSNITDSDTQLVSFDYENGVIVEGGIATGIELEKLWVIDNYFLLWGSANSYRLYYQDTASLDLSNFVTGTAGYVETSYAETIRDVLTKNDIFYILGSAGIEVWQNVGANDFPFRKQSYQSIAYSMLACANQDNLFSYPFFWMTDGDEFTVIAQSNENGQVNLLKLNNGNFRVVPLDWVKINSAFGSDLSNVVCWGLNPYRVNSKNVLILTGYSDAVNLVIEGNILIEEHNNVYTQLIATIPQLYFPMARHDKDARLLYETSDGDVNLLVETPNTAFDAVYSDSSNNLTMDSPLIFSPTRSATTSTALMIRWMPPLGVTPTGTSSLYQSQDGGNTWTLLLEESLNTSTQVINVSGLGSGLPPIQYRLVLTSPVIILSSVLSYREEGQSV